MKYTCITIKMHKHQKIDKLNEHIQTFDSPVKPGRFHFILQIFRTVTVTITMIHISIGPIMNKHSVMNTSNYISALQWRVCQFVFLSNVHCFSASSEMPLIIAVWAGKFGIGTQHLEIVPLIIVLGIILTASITPMSYDSYLLWVFICYPSVLIIVLYQASYF